MRPAGDIIIGPPEFPLCVDGIFSAVPGCAEADHFQSGVLLCDKARNCVNILDQLLRVPECDAVDALERIDPSAAAGDAEGAVDMAVSKRLAGDGRSVQIKLL